MSVLSEWWERNHRGKMYEYLDLVEPVCPRAKYAQLVKEYIFYESLRGIQPSINCPSIRNSVSTYFRKKRALKPALPVLLCKQMLAVRIMTDNRLTDWRVARGFRPEVSCLGQGKVKGWGEGGGGSVRGE